MLATEDQCHAVTQVDEKPPNAYVKPVTFHKQGDIGRSCSLVPKWHAPRLKKLVRSMVLLEGQTGVCIPRALEVPLNLAVSAGDLGAGIAAARAIRDHLVAHEVRS